VSRRLGLVAVSLILGLFMVVTAPPVSAHSNGRVELFLKDLQVTPQAGGVLVSADMIDRDSGEAASGFVVKVTGTRRGGGALEGVVVNETRDVPGRYGGTVPLSPGHWTLQVAAEQGTSVIPAVGSTQTVEVDVADAGAVNPASQLGTEPVRIELEVRTDYTDELPSPLYIPLRARLMDPDTGQPVAGAYEVRARVDAPGDTADETYSFVYPYGDTVGALPGVYNGIVIVPAGGSWTVLVNAFNLEEAEDKTLPRSLGSAQIEVEAVGPALESSGGSTDRRVQGNTDPSMEITEIVLLYGHTGLGAGWFFLAAAVAFLGHPARRRILSSHFGQVLDRNAGRVTTALAWTTGLLWASGILNLFNSTAYDPPLSGGQWNRLELLPYAQPYIASLYLKIAVYAVLTVATVALIRESKRRALEFDTERLLEERAAARGGSAPDGQLLVRTPVAAPAVAAHSSRTARLAMIAVAVGLPVIILCVTVLKYAHILSEQLRALG
jgi:hypothetical protein